MGGGADGGTRAGMIYMGGGAGILGMQLLMRSREGRVQ